MEWTGSPWFLPAAGLLAGFAMGFMARRHHFCVMSGLERYWYANDSEGVRTWFLAAAVALIATQALVLTGTLDLSSAFYLSPVFGLTGAIIGGLAFGFGMALVGTCGFGALVQTGGGSLRSFIMLILLGLSALAAQRGVMAQGRIIAVDNLAIDLSPAPDQSLGGLLSTLAGTDLRLATAAVAAIALLAWIFRDGSYRKAHGRIATGTVIGLAVTFGWLATGLAARTSFEPVQLEAGSFVVPVGDTIMHFATFTGIVPDYGVGLVVGVIIGAAVCAWWRDDMRWEACDDARELGRHLAGGFLMGTGGVFAMGCTIGQGVTAVSVMAISAPVVVASIWIGARMGLGFLLEGSLFSALRGERHDPAE